MRFDDAPVTVERLESEDPMTLCECLGAPGLGDTLGDQGLRRAYLLCL